MKFFLLDVFLWGYFCVSIYFRKCLVWRVYFQNIVSELTFIAEFTETSEIRNSRLMWLLMGVK